MVSLQGDDTDVFGLVAELGFGKGDAAVENSRELGFNEMDRFLVELARPVPCGDAEDIGESVQQSVC